MADMSEQFVDIQNKKKIHLTPDQIETIRDNPEGLTKEGCMKHIENWKLSKNRYAYAMYRVMLKKCEKFVKSGKIAANGHHVFSRDVKGNPAWHGTLVEEEPNVKEVR